MTISKSGKQKVEVTASTLPSGASTAANQTTIIGHLDGVEGLLTTIDADTGGIATSCASIDSKVTVCNTGAVTVSSCALPTGAATAANQTTIIGHLDGVEGLLGTIDADTGAIATSVASLDGKVTACNTGAVVVSSSALPSGAATAAKQDTGNASLASIDTKLTSPIAVTGGGGAQYTEGDTDASITGTAILWEDAADTLKPVSEVSRLPINLFTKGGGELTSHIYGSPAIPLDVSLVMADGELNSYISPVWVTSLAAHAEDTAVSSGDTGIGMLAIRKDTPANQSDTDGDYEFPQMSAGRLWTSANVDKINGVTPSVGSGASDSGTLRVVQADAATIAGDGVSPTVPGAASYQFLKTPGANTWTRQYCMVSGINNTGTGIAACGIIGQFDDTSPTTITENQFGNLRMSANRNLYGTIRDAAGNERGANVNASNQLSVSVDNAVDTELPAAATIAADAVAPTVPGVASYVFLKTPGANTWDRLYSAVNATNSTGTGIAAAAILAQFDDTSPTAITENQFGNVRMSANRNIYGTIRDAAGNERGANVDASNRLQVSAAQTAATSATLANVSASASSVTLQASNANRRGWMMFNDSASAAFIKFGATASATSFTVKVLAGGYYEMPLPAYTGVIDCIWATATGSARMTEIA